MEKRLALVVDDSRTARESLQRMLEQHNLAVATQDSAEGALEYLRQHTPDVIFMDHMMPGMDGFQAVEAIKGNPATATIPIMMYTSKEGDLYVSQARALGAVGILPKQVQPTELFDVLNKLGLVRERRSRHSPDSRMLLLDPPQEVALSATREQIADIADQAARAVQTHHAAPGLDSETLNRHHAELREQLQDLRETLARQVARRDSGVRWLTVLVIVVMLIPLVWALRQNEAARDQLEQVNQRIGRLAAAQQHQSRGPGGANTASHAPPQRARGLAQSVQIYDTIAWAINQGGSYDMTQDTFGDARLAMVQELVSRLHAIGFRGIVQLESHLGEFCLTGNDGSDLKLAAPDTPVTECSLIGHPQQQQPDAGTRQSIAFANFLATSPLLGRGDIRIEIVPMLFNRPRIAYPPRQSDVTARDWNRVAAANNRVEVRLLPDTE